MNVSANMKTSHRSPLAAMSRTSAFARLMPTFPDNEKVAHMVNYEWADNTAPVQRRFEQWVQS